MRSLARDSGCINIPGLEIRPIKARLKKDELVLWILSTGGYSIVKDSGALWKFPMGNI